MSPGHRSFLVALTVAACTASFVVGGAAAQAQNPQAQRHVLRVMTYNIKHGQTNAVCTQPAATPGQPPAPDCNLDLQAAIEVIRRHDPDIAGLQEVDRFWARSAHVDQPSVLSAETGLGHSCYAPNLDHAPDSHSDRPHQYGTVILSRFPILECTNTLLPLTGTNEQRGLTRALIDVQGTRLAFYNTHLHTTAADRLLQTARIAAVVDDAGAGTRVLVGDFNARPTAAEMGPIYERFLDAWQKAGTPAPENPDGHTSPARLTGDPTSRIDYVFVGPEVTVESASVPVDDGTRMASDHYPVVVAMVPRRDRRDQ
jgi:endonuclease/exonuclease/phosphatase family metal-dependent hydrolase